MQYRTDLIDEDVAKELIRNESSTFEELDTSVVELDQEQAIKYNRKAGMYITLNTKRTICGDIDFSNKIVDELSKLIKKGIKYFKILNLEKVFIVGLGNKYVTPDAIGPLALDDLVVTNHLGDDFGIKVGTLAPGVMGQTGLESAEIVKSITKSYKPDLVIVIDALASKSTSRLFKSIQISTTGISPGSGVKNHRKELSKETLGTNVMAIGVPTVVDIVSILNDYDSLKKEISDNLFLTPKEVDINVKETANIIANSINKALHF